MGKLDIDYITVAGRRSPGIAVLKSGGAPLKWDERAGYGMSGATLIFRGNGLVEFSVQLILLTEQDLADWVAWKPVVARPPSGKWAKSVQVWHPILEDLEVSAAVVLNVGALERQDTGATFVEIKFKQWRKPKLALVAPSGTKDATPVDPYDKKIEALSGQLSELLKK